MTDLEKKLKMNIRIREQETFDDLKHQSLTGKINEIVKQDLYRLKFPQQHQIQDHIQYENYLDLLIVKEDGNRHFVFVNNLKISRKFCI